MLNSNGVSLQVDESIKFAPEELAQYFRPVFEPDRHESRVTHSYVSNITLNPWSLFLLVHFFVLFLCCKYLFRPMWYGSPISDLSSISPYFACSPCSHYIYIYTHTHRDTRRVDRSLSKDRKDNFRNVPRRHFSRHGSSM